MSKKKKILLATITVFVLGLIWVTLNMNGNGEEGVEVQTTKVNRQKIVETVIATGRIQPKTQVNISADVSAKIVRLAVKEGDWVEKGDFLLQLDGERYFAAVERAEAALRSEQSQATLARENMLKAEKDYVRTRELFEQNLESQATLDAIGAAYEVEKARYESALDGVEQFRATLKQAKDDLSKTKIFAPMAGTISKLNKEEGEIALGSQFQEDVIMIVSNLAGMEALVDVDENDIISVSLGDTAKIEVDALPEVIFSGVVSEIANSAKISGQSTADQKTEFEVKVAIEGALASEANRPAGSSDEVKPVDNRPSRELRPGMTASSDIVTETRQNAICVPIQSVAVRTPEQLEKIPSKPNNNEAIADESQEQKYIPDQDGFVEVVFVVKNGTAEARQVTTGIQSDTHIEILQGIDEGDEIVIGNYRAISKDLENGSRVIIKNEPEKKG